MNKNIIIGIVARDEDFDSINFKIIAKNNMKYLVGKCSYIGIINYGGEVDYNVLDLCDGIIIPGGNKIHPYHFKILDYAINNNIPLLGICMGNQVIGLYSAGSNNEDDLVRVDNHFGNDITHNINIKKGSLLYKLFSDKLEVNSRHNFKVEEVNLPFKVSAYSDDKIIEGIEYIDDEHFIMGVQFHPEDLDNTECLYNYFLKEILKRKK